MPVLLLAEGIAGSESNFAEMMNEKAEEIGLTNTNFSNSSGINDPDNYLNRKRYSNNVRISY